MFGGGEAGKIFHIVPQFFKIYFTALNALARNFNLAIIIGQNKTLGY